MLPILFPILLRLGLILGVALSFGRSAQVCYTWQADAGGVNTATRARQTSLPIIGWDVRGGMPISCSLEHNSMATRHNGGLGNGKWLHSYDVRLVLSNGNTKATVEWAHLPQGFMLVNGLWVPIEGFRDTLVPTATNSFLLTTHGQIRYMFEATTDPTIHRLKTTKDLSNNTITLSYDTQARLTQVADPNGRNVRLSYSAITGRVTQIKFTALTYTRSWMLAYDASGVLNKVTYPTVTTENGAATYTTLLTTNAGTGNIEARTDRAGHEWQFGYSGDEAAWMQPPGNSSTERVTYTATALGSIVTDPTGVSTTYEYDVVGRLVRTIDDSGNMTNLTYADLDYPWAPSSVQSPTGEVTAYDYDLRGNLINFTPPGLGRFDLTWSNKNRLTKVLNPRVTDANGVLAPFRHRTDFVYDNKLRLIATKRFTTATQFIQRTLLWTPQGLLDTATNELAQVTDYSNDAYGNLVQVSTPGGRVSTWDFPDELSTAGFRLPAGSNVQGGPSADFVYDELVRLRERVQADNSGAKYHYDARDQLIKMEDATGTSTWTWAPQGYCEMSMDGGGWSAAYGHDVSGRVLSMTETGSFGTDVVTYAYDSRGLLASKVDGGTTTYQYDAAQRLVHTDLANGSTTDRTYTNGRLSSLTFFPTWDFVYEYQVDGRLMRKSELDGHTTEFFNDAVDRLILEDTFGPTDDCSIVHTYDNADRRIARDTDGVVTTFNFDADGLVQSLSDPNLGTWSYGWDPAGQLTSIQKPGDLVVLGWDHSHRLGTVDGGQTGKESHAYDGLDRRVVRMASDAAGMPLFTSEYHFNGSQLRREERDDGMATAQSTMSWGPGGLNSFFVVLPDLTTQERFPITDGTGSRALTDSAGVAVNFASRYDAFGRRLSHIGGEPPYQWGADAGVRTEGAGDLIDLGGGAWFEPEAGALACTSACNSRIFSVPQGGVMALTLNAGGTDTLFPWTDCIDHLSSGRSSAEVPFGAAGCGVLDIFDFLETTNPETKSYPDWPSVNNRARPHVDRDRCYPDCDTSTSLKPSKFTGGIWPPSVSGGSFRGGGGIY